MSRAKAGDVVTSSEPEDAQPPEHAESATETVGTGWGRFAWLWGATAVSALGDGVRLAAMPLLTISLTTNPAVVSLVAAANWVPLLFSPLAGVLADRMNNRTVIVAVDVLRAVVVALLTVFVLTGATSLPLVGIVAFLLGTGESLSIVVSLTFLPKVVFTTRLAKANGRLQAAQFVLRDSIGQPLGALLFTAFAAAPFLLDSISFALGVLLILAVTPLSASAVSSGGRGARKTARAAFAAGFTYLITDRLLLLLAIMLGLLNFFAVAVETLQALYVVTWLHLPEAMFGVLLLVGAAGGVLGSMAVARLGAAFGVLQATLLALTVIGLSCLVLGVSRDAVAAGLAFAGMNSGSSVFQALTVSLRQSTTPIGLLGTVNGVYRLIGTGTAPLGAIAAGAVGKAVGLSVPFLVSAAGLILLAACTAVPLLRLGAAAGLTDTDRRGSRLLRRRKWTQ
jgi:hypothetical protein